MAERSRNNRGGSPSLLQPDYFMSRHLRRFANPPPPPIISNWSIRHIHHQEEQEENDDDVQIIRDVPVSQDSGKVGPGPVPSEPPSTIIISNGNNQPQHEQDDDEPATMSSIERKLAEMEGVDEEDEDSFAVANVRGGGDGDPPQWQLTPPQSPSEAARRAEESCDAHAPTKQCPSSPVEVDFETFLEELLIPSVPSPEKKRGRRQQGFSCVKSSSRVESSKQNRSSSPKVSSGTTGGKLPSANSLVEISGAAKIKRRRNETDEGETDWQIKTGRPRISRVPSGSSSIHRQTNQPKDELVRETITPQPSTSSTVRSTSWQPEPVVSPQNTPKSSIFGTGYDYRRNAAAQRMRHSEPRPSSRTSTRLSVSERLRLATTCLVRGCPRHNSVMGRDETRKHLARAHNLKQCDVCLKALSTKGTIHKSHFLQEHARNPMETAHCPLCNLYFKYEGFYQHLARAHYLPEEERRRRISNRATPTSNGTTGSMAPGNSVHSSAGKPKSVSRRSSSDDANEPRSIQRNSTNNRSLMIRSESKTTPSSSSSSSRRSTSTTSRPASSSSSRRSGKDESMKIAPRQSSTSTTSSSSLENQRKPEVLIPLGQQRLRDVERNLVSRARSESLKNYRIPRSN